MSIGRCYWHGMNEPTEPNEDTQIVRPEIAKVAHIGDDLPKVGEWFWVLYEDWDKKAKRELFCVAHLASNHVLFDQPDEHGSSSVKVRYEELLTDTEKALNWQQEVLSNMERVRSEIEEQTRSMMEEGYKANALTDPNAKADTSNGMQLSIRTSDPVRQKRDLEKLKKKLPEITQAIDALAKEYAVWAKHLCHSELVKMHKVKKELAVLDDKIFLIEVYAGLQEEVKQIRKGKPAKVTERITVRQSMLYMDEETLIDYDQGGMDFQNLSDFDRWVAKPDNCNRVLPEERGIVAFRVRREAKDYGHAETIGEALMHIEFKHANLETYLLIRNGERLYRIASSVDFSPRLIPMKDEFDDHLIDRDRGWWNFEKSEYDNATETRITPDNLRYDEFVDKLKKDLTQYNRVMVLIQGLFDRSECFSPHPMINLAQEKDIQDWLNPVRDEEMVLENFTGETWEQYRDRLNMTIEPGTMVCTQYIDLRRHSNCMPKFLRVTKVRMGTKADKIAPYYDYSARSRDWRSDQSHDGRKAVDCIGRIGVEVSWTEKINDWRRDDDATKEMRFWIPIEAVFNMDAYPKGDYKRMLCDRRAKKVYVKWAWSILKAEDYKLGRIKL